MTKENLNIKNLIIFISSPILAFPLVLKDVYKNRKLSNGMLVVFFGIVSYLYVPFYSNDKVRYLELYNSVNFYNLSEFIQYLVFINRPDFIFHIFIFVMAKVGLSFKIIISLITMITIGIWLKVFDKVTAYFNVNKIYRFFGITLLILGIQYAALLSGIRFYFASAFILLAIYHSLFNKNKIYEYSFLLIATLIHFSAVFFILVLLVNALIKNKKHLLNVLFIASFSLLLIEPHLYIYFFDLSFLGEAFSIKQEVYFENEDFLISGIQKNINSLYVYIIGNLWFVFFVFYLLFTLKRKSDLRSLLLVIIIFLNALYHFPTVHFRYLLIVKLIAILLILVESFQNKSSKSLLFLALLFVLNLFTQWIVMRVNIDVSYLNINNLLLPGILFQEQIDFIPN